VKRHAALVISVLVLVALAACDKDGNPASPCVTTASVAASSFGPTGGSTSLQIDTRPSCTWTLSSDAWIVPDRKSGEGGATVAVTVNPNPAGSARSGAITIGQQRLELQQSGCAAAIADLPEDFGAAAANVTARITTTAACQWTVATSATWVRFDPASGAGPSDVRVIVDSNPGTDTRSATISVNAQPMTIRQGGARAQCSYEVAPVEYLAMALAERGEFAINTAPGCAWQIEPTDNWIAIESPASGQGPATVRYAISPNPSKFGNTIRSAPIRVRWPTPAGGQDVSVSQLPDCTTVIYRPADQRVIDRIDVAANGGRLGVEVLVDLPFSCPWSARSEAAWLTVEFPAFPSIARGDGGVVLIVASNGTGQQRTGRVQVGERYLIVVQAAQ